MSALLPWLTFVFVAGAAFVGVRRALRLPPALPSPAGASAARGESVVASIASDRVRVEFDESDVLLTFGRFRETCVAWSDLAATVTMLASHRSGDFLVRGTRGTKEVVALYVPEALVPMLHEDLARALHAYEGRGRAPKAALRALNGGKAARP